MTQHLQDEWEELEKLSRSVYEMALRYGMKKEDARFALLAGSETELNLCLNFQAWQDFLHNRTGKHAQWEVRAVALEIERQLHELAPELFSLT
jgi:thymidylate synthase (FAD)